MAKAVENFDDISNVIHALINCQYAVSELGPLGCQAIGLNHFGIHGQCNP
jgi:hypothetical protein